MSASTTSIDKAFESDSKMFGKYPPWAVRLVTAFVIALTSILLLKPRFAADIEYDPKTNKCELKTKWKNVFIGSVVGMILFYVVLLKYM